MVPKSAVVVSLDCFCDYSKKKYFEPIFIFICVQYFPQLLDFKKSCYY